MVNICTPKERGADTRPIPHIYVYCDGQIVENNDILCPMSTSKGHLGGRGFKPKYEMIRRKPPFNGHSKVIGVHHLRIYNTPIRLCKW